MARNEPQINFRLPEALKAKIEASAKEAGRTITAEIVFQLMEAYERDEIAAERQKTHDVIKGGQVVDLNILTATIERIRSDFDDLKKQIPALIENERKSRE